MLRLLPGLTLLASCASTHVVYPDDDDLISDVDMAQDIWENQSIRDYRFVYHSETFGCGMPTVAVTVRDTEVRSVRFDDQNTGCQSRNRHKKGQDARSIYPHTAVTIGDLFDRIRGVRSPNGVEATFHPTYGFPTRIFIYHRQIDDDYAMIYINRFEIL